MDEVVGDYRILRVLGKGGMGITYEAERTTDGVRVALKQLRLSRVDDWKVLELFEREARVLANITHPNVPAYVDHFKVDSDDGPTFYLAQQLANGKSLADRAAEGFRADEATVKQIAMTLLDVLEYLHARRPPIFHRDIKPQNVLLDDAGKVWLVDFGSVRDVYKTTAGGSTIAGTFGYMAPEQLRGVARPESDLYALGATLVFALSGRSPTDLPQVKLRIHFQPHVNVSKDMSAWLAKMIEPAPEDRFASARAAINALRDPPKSAPRSRTTTVILATVLGLVVVGSAGFVAVTERRAKTLHEAALAPKKEVAPLPPRPPLPSFPALTFLRSVVASHEYLRGIAFTPDGKTLITAGGDGTVRMLDASTGESLHALPGHSGRLAGVAVTPDGRNAVTAGDHTIRVWSLPDGKPVRTIDVGATIFSVALSPNGKTIVVGIGAAAKVWSLEGAAVATLPHDLRERVLTVAFSPDGSRVITGGDAKNIEAWTTNDWKLQRTFAGHTAAIDRALVAPDGQTLISASDDHSVRLWHLETGRALATLSLHTDEVWTLAISPDGGTLVTGGKDHHLGVWSLPWGVLKQDVTLNEKTVTLALAFSPDGSTVTSAHAGFFYAWRLARNIAHTALPEVVIAPNVLPATATPEQRAYANATDLIDAYAGDPSSLVRAKALLEDMLKTNPRSALAYAGLGRAAFIGGMRSSKDYDPDALKIANDMADKAIAIDPTLADAYCVRGSAASASKDKAAAATAVARALALAPNMPRALILSANLHVDDGDLDGAEKLMRGLLALPVSSATALRALEALCDVYEKLGDYEATDRAHRKLIELVPEDAWLKGNYARFLLHNHDPDGAIAMAKKALAQMDYGAPRSILAEAYCSKGETALWDRKDVDAARTQFEAALAASPAYARTAYDFGAYHQFLASTRKDEKELEQARVFYEKANAFDPKDLSAKKALDALQ